MLNEDEKNVLNVVKLLAGFEGGFFSVQDISKISGYNERKTKRTLEILRNKGFVRNTELRSDNYGFDN